MSVELNEKQLDLMPFIAIHQLMNRHPNRELVNYLHNHLRKSRHAKQYAAGAWEWIGLNRAEAGSEQ